MSGKITLIASTSETAGARPMPSRPLTSQDVPALAELFHEAYGSATLASPDEARDVIQGVFDGKYGPFLPELSPAIEDENGQVIAAALVLQRREGENYPHAPYLFELSTARTHRRRGLAEQLVREVLTTLHREGHQNLSLRIAEDNAAALALYLTLDFHRWSPDVDDDD